MTKPYEWGDTAPFLKIARDFDVPYTHVLCYADIRQREMSTDVERYRQPWSAHERAAWEFVFRRLDLRVTISERVKAWLITRNELKATCR